MTIPLLLAVVLSATPELARTPDARCSCPMPASGALPLFSEGQAVFLGRALAIDDTSGRRDDALRSWLRRRYVVEVERAWAGAVPKVADVWTGLPGGDCGASFDVGEQYLMYVEVPPWDGVPLWTDICRPTALARDAPARLAALHSRRSWIPLPGSVPARPASAPSHDSSHG